MLFPIKDYNPTRRRAYITLLLIAINIVVFIYQGLLTNLEGHILKSAMIPWEITHFQNIKQPIAYQVEVQYGIEIGKSPIYRKIPPLFSLISSLFMHGSLWHLLGNMLFLWIFGNNIEDHLGRWRFILFYFISGIGASLVHVLFNFNSIIPVLGASGAVSGVMGAYLILYPNARIKTIVFIIIFFTITDLPAGVFLIVWFLFQFLNIGGGSGIAWLAHVGGFIIGVILIKKMRRRQWPIIEIIQ